MADSIQKFLAAPVPTWLVLAVALILWADIKLAVNKIVDAMGLNQK